MLELAVELELLRYLAGCDVARDRAASRIRALAERADLDVFARDLEARRLLPLIGRRLLSATAASGPEPFLSLVAAAHARDRAANMALQERTRQVVGLLAAGGVAALPIKGPGLAERVHGDVGLRSAGDVDLLLARSDLLKATSLLRSEGYADATDPVDGEGLPHLHFAMAHPHHPTVELHWRVHWHEEAFSRDMLARAVPGVDGVLIPDPVDEVAALFLFFARDGFLGVRMIADIGSWWDRHGHRHGPGLLEDHLRRYPELARTWRAAVLAVTRLGGTPPGAWLTPGERVDRRVGLAVRLASWSQRDDPDQLAANQALIDGLLSPRGALGRFARRHGGGPMRSAVPHSAKLAVRFVVAMWRVRRRPWEPAPSFGDQLPAER